jgi:hypothetical protein
LPAQHITELDVRNRQIALPPQIAAFEIGQPFGDGMAVAVGPQRVPEVASRDRYVSYLLIAGRARKASV